MNLSSSPQQYFSSLMALIIPQLAWQPFLAIALLIISMVKVLVIIILARVTAFIMVITEAIIIKVLVTVNVMVKIEVLPFSYDCFQ